MPAPPAAGPHAPLGRQPWEREILLAIPSINGGGLLARMLPTLRFDPLSVVVLDQGSTDDTAAVCARAGVEVVQLGHPHSYTLACNLGARLARERGRPFVCVANNDITFESDVLRALWEAMREDPNLAVAAPSQVIVDERRGLRVLAKRVQWGLDAVAFHHDTAPFPPALERLDADFCELTLALVRLSAIDAVGFLDDDYGFYHEDADLAFRLREAGWGAAYLPRAQIHHFTSSTFDREPGTRKADFIARNRRRFAEKHLGYGLQIPSGAGPGASGALVAALDPYLRRYGLHDPDGPGLRALAQGPGLPQGTGPGDYVLTALDAPQVPPEVVAALRDVRGVLAASEGVARGLAEAGVAAFHVPLGVETDVFHPWGDAEPFHGPRGGTTYAAVLDAHEHRSLRAILAAWGRFGAPAKGARLVLLGRGLRRAVGLVPSGTFTTGEVDVALYDDARVELREPRGPLSPEARARFLRAADVALIAPCGEGPPLAALEAMACGVPCVLADYGLSGEIAPEGAITYGRLAAADPGADWKPDVEGMADALERARGLGEGARAALSRAGLARVRAGFTLRHSAMAVRAALARTQARDPSRHLRALGSRAALVPPAAAPAGTSAGAPARPLVAVLSNGVARGLRRAGRLTEGFGTAWEQTGLTSATRIAARRVLAAAGPALKRGARLGARALRPSLDRAVAWIGDLGPRPRVVAGSALLVGYIDGQLGLGQSLRGLVHALSTTDARFSVYPLGLGVEGRRTVEHPSDRYDLAGAHAVTVIEVTGDELPRVLHHLGRRRLAGGTTVLRTYWELGAGPEAWRAGLRGVDEIWAPNRFVADSLRTIFDGPITVVPPCVEVPDARADRARFGLDEGAHLFLFSFDYHSFPQRKNPLGVLRAFQRAFAGSDARVGLVVKTTGARDHHPELRRELLAAAAQDGRIRVLDESIPREGMLALIASVDGYVSLHRAEGFGLGMAEAMALGKPVIATGYSGNAEFVTPDTAYPIPYALRPLEPGEYVHAAGQVWAEPDEAACAAAMVRVVEHPAEAAARAAAGQRFVRERYGAANVGRVAGERLRAILAAPPPQARGQGRG